jgi:hypothetical protein
VLLTDKEPIHHLLAKLETARLQAIEELAAAGGEPAADSLKRIAYLHAALDAVRDEIKAHEVKIGPTAASGPWNSEGLRPQTVSPAADITPRKIRASASTLKAQISTSQPIRRSQSFPAPVACVNGSA